MGIIYIIKTNESLKMNKKQKTNDENDLDCILDLNKNKINDVINSNFNGNNNIIKNNDDAIDEFLNNEANDDDVPENIKNKVMLKELNDMPNTNNKSETILF